MGSLTSFWMRFVNEASQGFPAKSDESCGNIQCTAPHTGRLGGVGVSGDTSCADHNIAWRTRHFLGLDHMAATTIAGPILGPVGGVSGDPARPDNIVFDFAPNANGGPNSASASGFGHPKCLFTGDPSTLPAVQP